MCSHACLLQCLLHEGLGIYRNLTLSLIYYHLERLLLVQTFPEQVHSISPGVETSTVVSVRFFLSISISRFPKRRASAGCGLIMNEFLLLCSPSDKVTFTSNIYYHYYLLTLR